MNEITKIIQEGKKNKVEGSRDKKSPFTGNLKLRGKTFTGIVVSKDTHRTAQVEWTKQHFVKKYERFMIKRTKVAVHNPDSINANIGDQVLIAECKPLSKTKKFVIIKNIAYSLKYMVKKEVIEDDKKVKKEPKGKPQIHQSNQPADDVDKAESQTSLDNASGEEQK